MYIYNLNQAVQSKLEIQNPHSLPTLSLNIRKANTTNCPPTPITPLPPTAEVKAAPVQLLPSSVPSCQP